MSVKSSLRLSLILLASLPLVLLTILTYSISYNKYMDLAKSSASDLANNYSEGFFTQLNTQIAQVEGLSHTSSIQNIALEYYNGVSTGVDSAYFNSATQLLTTSSTYANNYVQYYVYDLNGYLITSSDSAANEDWDEYMNMPIQTITKTQVIKSSNINKDYNSIEVVSPIIVKETIIGLIRCNIKSSHFGAFIPDSGNAFILTDNGDYLFNSSGLSDHKDLENYAHGLFDNNKSFGCLKTSSLKKIYGYSKISDYNWIYIIKLDEQRYKEVLSTLPLTLIITLVFIILIAIWISHILVHKFTDPIMILKKDMEEATSGNLDITCDFKSNDEFGELSDMFNNMMNIISTNYRELADSKKALEANELELKQNYNDIEHLAFHDSLTKLYNRNAFMKKAHDLFHKDGAQFSKHAIFFLDLDNFKNVNDTLGHDYGDELLKQVSSRLLSSISDNDILARTGGDEFLILKASYNNIESLEDYAKTLIRLIHEPFDLEGEMVTISLSIGISLFPRDGLTISELIKNADIAMYNAKNYGKNDYRLFNSYMEDDFNRRNDLADILANVIDRNEIYLQYQPQVNVATGEIIGFEALMRIDSELIGFVPPSEFIPIAEESGHINKLGEWALYEACNFNQSLINMGYEPLKVSVNVSPTQLKSNDFLDIIKSIPQKTGMDLKYLELEITESVLINSFEHNLKLINQIRELGTTISLDDFGTGYSSLNYLTQIPIDTLKIDKSFVDRLCNNPKDRYISHSIISLAHNMNISVVAEGVESIEQLSILREQTCDTLQGYLFSKPLMTADFINLLNKNKNVS